MSLLNTSNSSSNSTPSWNADPVAPSVVLGLCWLVGVPSNIAVVVVIARNFKRENFTLKLMLNLAVSDLLCLITLPVWIYSLLYGWSFGPAVCKFVSYLLYCSSCTSLLTVTLMSVQRYLTVLYPQCWARLRVTGERVLLVALWGLAGVISCPSFMLRNVGIEEDYRKVECIRNYRSDMQEVAILLLETLLGFVLPFSILVTSYFCLHKKVNQTAFFSSQRMTKLVTSIVVTFFIFWFPLHVINMVDISITLLKTSHPDTYESLKSFRRASGDVSQALVLINSCINPFLYAFASRSLRSNAQQTEEKKAATQTSNV
ncbi:leukotriene B4 receptor 1-like [Megalops cyprinoides]|uniref:leukotriene B4 receptor 1-like n=1 Tax=Megalops cyprinoides TaxID=118141 RepID=UPI00186482C8|nr:leukotriene B4 receptor 1-like [Megalops cyprinoides]